jgi:hypothetical protein
MREAEMIVLFEDKKPERGPAKTTGETPVERPLFGRSSWRKARAIADVADGLLTAEEACERYGLTAEELATWQRALQSFGIKSRHGKPGSKV